MNRKRRTKIFIDYASDQVVDLAEIIEKDYQVELIEEPTEGLVMIKTRESARNTLFYLGEVLVTQTKVRIQDQLGLGLVKGTNPKLSWALAVVDAAFELDLPIVKEWTPVFEQCEKKGLEDLERQRDMIGSTKVDFETMDV